MKINGYLVTRKKCLPRRGVGLWEVRKVVIVSGQLEVGLQVQSELLISKQPFGPQKVCGED